MANTIQRGSGERSEVDGTGDGIGDGPSSGRGGRPRKPESVFSITPDQG